MKKGDHGQASAPSLPQSQQDVDSHGSAPHKSLGMRAQQWGWECSQSIHGDCSSPALLLGVCLLNCRKQCFSWAVQFGILWTCAPAVRHGDISSSKPGAC